MIGIFEGKKCKIVLDGEKAPEHLDSFKNSFLLQINSNDMLRWTKESAQDQWYYDYLEDGKYYWWAFKSDVKILKQKEIEIE